MQPTYDKRWYEEQLAEYSREWTNEYQAPTFIANRCAVAIAGMALQLTDLTFMEETSTFLLCDLGDMIQALDASA